MDVRLPDGTLIQNVPDGTTKAQLIEKLQGSGYDVSHLVAGAATQELSKPVTVSGVVAEGAKGLLRGASNTAKMVGEGVLGLTPAGAILKPQVSAGLDQLSNRSVVAPNPQNPAEQMASTGSEIAGSVAAGGPTGGLRQTAINTLVPAAGGAVGEQVAGEPGKLIGSLALPATQIAKAGVDAARGSLASKVQGNVEQFREAGAGTPSVGQATELNFFQGLENLLSKFPGGQAVFRRFAEKQQGNMGAAAKTGTSAEDAGRAIEKGITGEGGFIERTKATWLQLDEKLGAKVGNANLAPTNTAKALDDLVAPVAGAERTTGAMANPKLAQIRENLAADLEANGGQLPFEALRKIRSRVGMMLDDSLVAGIPGGELKKLYGAMSQDLEAAATTAGAKAEFARQSQFYAARIDRIENMLERTIGKTPEETFKRFMPTDPDKVTTVRGVMRSLDPEQRKVVQEAVVSRLGRAKSGAQDATGEVFSSETFLTNWNNMSPGAKAQIFSDPAVRKNMDAIAASASNIREGSQVFANPSGTAGRSAGYVLAGAVGTSVATGNVLPATAAALSVGAANVGARMLTNPGVVEWLAQAPRVGAGEMAGHIARLGVIFNGTKDQGLKQELSDYMQNVASANTDYSPPGRGSPAGMATGGTR